MLLRGVGPMPALRSPLIMANGPPPADGPESSVESKSARKRAHQAVQSLAESLLELPDALLDRVPLDSSVRDAVAFGRSLSKGARKRHVRHLANQLGEHDLDTIREALAAIRGESRRETARLHRAERWRDRLIGEGDAVLGELGEAYPGVDRQRVREYLRGILRERERDAPPRQFRALLRYLRELDQTTEADDVPAAPSQ